MARDAALIIDDDPWIRTLLSDLLESEGYAVQEASNGSTALRLAERDCPSLVLLDLSLPEGSGLNVLADLRATPTTAGVPVIVVSGRADAHTAAGQATAVLTKPFTPAELLAEVARARQAA
jgi:DNA-binding response OmpR family regulator